MVPEVIGDGDEETTTTFGAVIVDAELREFDEVGDCGIDELLDILVARFKASYWVDPGELLFNIPGIEIGFAYPCCCCCCCC